VRHKSRSEEARKMFMLRERWQLWAEVGQRGRAHTACLVTRVGILDHDKHSKYMMHA
jgi:hypothetical protein